MQHRRRNNPIEVGERVIVIAGQLRGLEGVVTAREPGGRVVIEGVLDQPGLSVRTDSRRVRRVEPGDSNPASGVPFDGK